MASGCQTFKLSVYRILRKYIVLTDQLWTAPELLRDLAAPPCGSQKGDVYSFAIVLYEIHGRKGPYGDIGLSPKGTKKRKVYIQLKKEWEKAAWV